MQKPNYIQYIIDNYSNQLLAKLKSERKFTTVEDAMDVLLACDPTPNKRLVDWLVKTYIANGFRWEDVEIGADSKLAEVLGMYLTHFNRIPRDQRNIYEYQSYGELYTLVEPYLFKTVEDTSIGSREIKRKERAQAIQESEVLYRSEDMIVAVPLTEMASKWWGKGTKWCTAALKNNMFDEYNRNAPLIVITLLNPYSIQNPCSAIDQTSDSALKNQDLSLRNESSSLRNENFSKEGAEKFQLWMHEDEIQFMNAQDNQVNQSVIERNWKQFEPVILSMMEINASLIRYIPERLRTLEICTLVIKEDGWLLSYVPKNLISAEICRLAVEQNGDSLLYVPSKLKTKELCKLAVDQSGSAIRFVPNKYKTLQLSRKAVEKDGNAINYIPLRFKTTELYRLAVEQTPSAIYYIANEHKTAELCIQAVKSYGYSLSWIPHEMKTVELCWLAVKQSGLALECVPTEFINSELCMLAISNDADALGCMPIHLITPEICRIAVKQNGFNIINIPEALKTHELCRLAVEQNYSTFFYIGNEYKTDRLKEFYEISDKNNRDTKKLWDQSIISRLKKGLENYLVQDQSSTDLEEHSALKQKN